MVWIKWIYLWDIICLVETSFHYHVDRNLLKQLLHKKCPYSELFWSAFSHIWTEYGEMLRISPYSVRMWENEDENNFEYEHFLSSVLVSA